MGFKEKIQEKIERNAVKSELTWTDKDGVEHKENVILKKSKLPLVGDWGRIYPPINEDGSANWFNILFGGKKNFIKLLLIMFILIMLYVWMSGVIGASKEYLNGQKYVIIEKEAFGKFCSTSITDTNNKIEPYNTPANLTIYFIDQGEE